MENLVCGKNRLQGVLRGDVLTFLKGVLMKKNIKHILKFEKRDLMDLYFFCWHQQKSYTFLSMVL